LVGQNAAEIGPSTGLQIGFDPLEFAAVIYVKQAVGPSILVFLAGVVVVGIAGAFYTVNKEPASYGDRDNAGE